MVPVQSTDCIFDAHGPLAKAAELQWSEVDVPQLVIDFFPADVLSDSCAGGIHPAFVPANAPASANVSDFESIGILEADDGRRHGTLRRVISRRSRVHLQRFVWSLEVELGNEQSELALARSKLSTHALYRAPNQVKRRSISRDGLCSGPNGMNARPVRRMLPNPRMKTDAQQRCCAPLFRAAYEYCSSSL